MKNVLEEYNKVECKGVGKPDPEIEKLSKQNCVTDCSEEELEVQSKDFRGLIGS